jgi:hypothetical protein
MTYFSSQSTLFATTARAATPTTAWAALLADEGVAVE